MCASVPGRVQFDRPLYKVFLKQMDEISMLFKLVRSMLMCTLLF